MTLMRSLAYLLLTLAAFLAVASLINALGSPQPLGDRPMDGDARALADKLRYFEEDRHSYDAAFFGTSRMLAGPIPKHFDAEMAAQGLPVRSFNFAMNSMRGHETEALIRRILAMKPQRLRWAIIELGHWTGSIPPALELRPRTILWHDLPSTLAAMRSVFLYSGQPAVKKVDLAVSHFLHLAANAAAVGRGPQALRSLTRSRGEQRPIPSWLVEDQGYLQPGWGRNALLDHIETYERHVQRLRKQRLRKASKKRPPSVDLTKYNVRALEDQMTGLRQAGVEPVYVLLPELVANHPLHALKDQGVVRNLLAFDDPGAYPELYLVKHRWDPLHLNTAGAEIFTTLLAERFAALAGASGS